MITASSCKKWFLSTPPTEGLASSKAEIQILPRDISIPGHFGLPLEAWDDVGVLGPMRLGYVTSSLELLFPDGVWPLSMDNFEKFYPRPSPFADSDLEKVAFEGDDFSS